MSRVLNRLSARTVAALKEPNRYADGGGLYVRVTKQGAKSYSFITTKGGKTREIGLGATRSVSLASARCLAAGMREAVALGRDPRSLLASAPTASEAPVTTFGEFAELYITSIEAGWKNANHRHQWRQSLRDHAVTLWPLPIDEIGTEQVLAVLQPIWLVKSETASRVRGRIERILDAAKARGLRSVDASNPAQLRGHLALLLPKQAKLTRGHHAALPWKQAPKFMVELRQRSALAARALEFTILTAARSGETLGAKWAEIDMKAGLWTVPAVRMKASVEHVVPLSSAALKLLASLEPDNALPSDAVFGIGGVPRSNMAMAQLLKRMKYPDITTHGFRSTFRDWAGDETEYSRELMEQALAHTIGNKAERAYRRGTAINRRRELMEAWATYLASQPASVATLLK